MDREALVTQMAKVIAGMPVMDSCPPAPEQERRAEEALARVERFLGVDIERAQELLSKVMEDVS